MTETLQASQEALAAVGGCLASIGHAPWADIVSDTVIAISLFSIPVTLNAIVAGRQEIPYARLIRGFAATILGCAIVLVVSHWLFAFPGRDVEDAVEIVTAVGAFGTALSLLLLATTVRSMPTPASLQRVNDELALRLREKDQAIRALQESNRLLLLAEDLAGAGHFRFEVAGRERKWSKGLRTIFGFGNDDAVPGIDDAVNGYRGEDAKRVRAMVSDAIATGEPFQFEASVERPDGSVRHLAAKGVCERGVRGDVEAVFGVCLDVTETRRMEAKLSDQVALLDRAGQVAGFGAWEIDLGSGTIEWSAQTRAIHDVDADYAPDPETSLSFYGPQARKTLKEAYEQAVANGTPWDLELPMTTATGRRVWVRAAGQAAFKDGLPSRVFGIFKDITERKQVEIDREAARLTLEEARAGAEASRRAAEEANRAKTQFLASMSHEIRTPLSSIVGYAELLMDGSFPVEQRRKVEWIQSSATALLALVNDILDFSKIEDGKFEIRREVFRLRDVVEAAVAMLAGQAMSKDIAVAAEVDDVVPEIVIGDPDRVRQVLLNLLGNAVKFTSRGSVTLSIRAAGEGGWEAPLLFSVRDTGMGIAKSRQGRLFERFSQVDGGSGRGGTGLGLAISKSLVEMMGGEIGLESDEGAGATFWFSLPLPEIAPQAAVPPGEFISILQRECEGARVLVVDDIEVNRDLARSVLTSLGHVAEVAASGREAVSHLQARAYDLVLMDIQMPDMDGIETTLRIRELPDPARTVPIFAMTANVLPQQVEACANAGMDGHIGKPFRRAQLEALIVRTMADSRRPSPDSRNERAARFCRQRLSGPGDTG